MISPRSTLSFNKTENTFYWKRAEPARCLLLPPAFPLFCIWSKGHFMVVTPVHPNTIWIRIDTENGKNRLHLHILVKDNVPLPPWSLCFLLHPPSYAQSCTAPAQLLHSSCTAPALLLHCSCRGDGISHSKSMQSGNQISIKSCWDVQSMSQCLDPPEMCQAQRGHRKVSSWHAVLLCSLAVHCNKLLRNFLWQPVPPVHNITDRSELEETLNIF